MAQATEVKLADQVWIATALLHCEHPEREGFSPSEIITRVREEFGQARPGIAIHVSQHCVATRPPNPGRYRMLSTAGRRLWRLFKSGDPCHPEREGGKACPVEADIPDQYLRLLSWYRDYSARPSPFTEDHPLFELMGAWESGRSDLSVSHDRHLAAAYEEETSRGRAGRTE